MKISIKYILHSIIYEPATFYIVVCKLWMQVLCPPSNYSLMAETGNKQKENRDKERKNQLPLWENYKNDKTVSVGFQ